VERWSSSSSTGQPTPGITCSYDPVRPDTAALIEKQQRVRKPIPGFARWSQHSLIGVLC